MLQYGAIDDLALIWRKAMCRIYSIPYNVHSDFLRLLCQCLLLLDELCKRSLRYMSAYLSQDSAIVRGVPSRT